MSAQLLDPREAQLLVPRQAPGAGNGNNGGDNGGNGGNTGGNTGGNNGGNTGGNNGGNTGGNNGGNTGGNNGNNGNNGGNNGNGNNGGNNGNGNNGGNNGNQSGSVSQRPSGSASGNATRSVSIPQTAALGGVTMIQPASKMGTSSYYPVAPSQFITFKWNLTSLYVQPTSLTVVAYCSQNGNTYPVGPTGGTSNTIPGNQSQVVWNPYEWSTREGQIPFAMASYTLKIYDERGEGSKPQGGYLAPYSGTIFGMYLPKAYTPLADWTCPTCSGALPSISDPATLSVFTSLFIVLITAWGILRRD